MPNNNDENNHSTNNEPTIIKTDIGHIPPRMTIINGAIAVINSKNGKGTIEFFLK